MSAPRAIIQTSLGNIVLELDPVKAPITVENFCKYIEARHYDGLVFHRVIKDFMIQGGGMDTEMRQKATLPPIRNESFNGLLNNRGTIAMARTGVPDSATCQFFINHKDNDFLNGDARAEKHGYAVFGKVVEGMDVVDQIAAVKTGKKGPHGDVPLQPVSIISIRLEAK